MKIEQISLDESGNSAYIIYKGGMVDILRLKQISGTESPLSHSELCQKALIEFIFANTEDRSVPYYIKAEKG